MSTYKLYYFNRRGRAEVIRLIFAAAGQKYEDIRYTQEEWAVHKAEMPLGQIPVLEVDGVRLPQSGAITRFLANRFNLAGKDNFEQAKVDAVADTFNDLIAALLSSRTEKDATKKEEMTKKFFTEDLPKYCENLEKLAKSYGNGGPYFVGNQLTWADLYLHAMGEILLDLNGTALDNFAWLKQNRAEVEKQPRIAEYLKNRPRTQY